MKHRKQFNLLVTRRAAAATSTANVPGHCWLSWRHGNPRSQCLPCSGLPAYVSPSRASAFVSGASELEYSSSGGCPAAAFPKADLAASGSCSRRATMPSRTNNSG